MNDIGEGNKAFVLFTDKLLDHYIKWRDKYGEDRAMERFDTRNKRFLDKLSRKMETERAITLDERAFVAAIHYASLLIVAGEI